MGFLIETVKFNLFYLEGGRRWSSGYDLGLPGRRISAKQAYNPGSNPGRRISFLAPILTLNAEIFSLDLYPSLTSCCFMNSGGEISNARGLLAEKIAGEITLSQSPGDTLRKWRRNFGITQTDLSNHLGISPSVISDYESGRRKSPGIMIVSKIIDALLRIDESRGCNVLRAYEDMWGDILGLDSICSVCEYQEPIALAFVAEKLNAEVIFGRTDITIWGYTVIDSRKAIVEMLPDQFQKIYGRSTARALIFTGVHSGKSPMVAVRVSNLKPGAVVLQGLTPHEVDPIARRIAEVENIPLLTTHFSVDEITSALSKG
jgi:putative transcriptional regulator